MGSLVSFFVLQNRSSIEEVARNQALEIAEAGLNYYRWTLAHDPDYYNTTTTISRVYNDPQGGAIGEYLIEVTAPTACSTQVGIKSTGWTYDKPSLRRAVQVSFGNPSLGQYGFLTDSNIWFGGGTIYGPIHSNGGIRMDAENNALVTSALDEYKCGTEHGCEHPWEWQDGVWGSGSGGAQGLWQFPVTAVDFDAITVDLAELETIAQSGGGTFLGDSNGYGWHVRFMGDGTANVYRVTQKRPQVHGYNGQNWTYESNSILTEEFDRTVTLPSNCGNTNLIFSEEDLWVDGVADRRATLVAADFPYNANNNASIIIHDSITYATSSDAKVALIAQEDIRIPLYSSDTLDLDPILFAQQGKVHRYFYCPPGYYGIPGLDNTFCNPNGAWALRSTLNLRGSIVSNGIAVTSWVNESSQVVSGYQGGSTSYDASLIFDPPPFLPTLGEADNISWEEVDPS